jgi:galactokinase
MNREAFILEFTVRVPAFTRGWFTLTFPQQPQLAEQRMERVLSSVEAFERGDLVAVGHTWAASHASLRELYEVSSPELDALVEIAATTPGVYAARMTGAGFGGCTVNLVEEGAVDRLRHKVDTEYPLRTGRRAAVVPVAATGGAGAVSQPNAT